MTQTLMRRMESARRERAARIERVWLVCGWLGIVVTLMLSLMPPTLGDATTHLDKLAHLLGYALLMFWWAQLITRKRWKLALAVVIFGIVIELLQGLTPDRQPDPLDALANTAGMLLGWFAACRLPNLLERLGLLPEHRR